MSKLMTTVDYNPQWPAIYEEEKARLLAAIEDKVVAIEHVGSTAVPGVCAKPIYRYYPSCPSHVLMPMNAYLGLIADVLPFKESLLRDS